MRNPHDEYELQALIHEMNIGFSAPQNGGVDGSGVIILQNGEDPEAIDDEQNNPDDKFNVEQALTAIIENLNHIKMDVDQGCRGDAQIEQLQQCCTSIGQVIEEIGNNAAGKTQDSAYSGLSNQDPNANDTPGGEAAAEAGMALAT